MWLLRWLFFGLSGMDQLCWGRQQLGSFFCFQNNSCRTQPTSTPFNAEGWKVCHDSPPTPKLQVRPRRLRSGIELDRFYSYQFCSPARSAIQTGRNPVHVNVQNVKPECVNSKDQEGGFQAERAWLDSSDHLHKFKLIASCYYLVRHLLLLARHLLLLGTRT